MANFYREQYRFSGDADCLIHYGISGQKWGVRRYQNEDGSLTEEGRQRYYGEADQHDRDLYDNLTEDGRKVVDRYMASGMSMKEALEASVRNTANQVRKEQYKTQMMHRATNFIAGYGTTLIGDIAVGRGHATLGSILRGVGKGFMIGNVIGAGMDTIVNAGAKNMINKLTTSDMEVTDKKTPEERRRGYRSTQSERHAPGTRF